MKRERKPSKQFLTEASFGHPQQQEQPPNSDKMHVDFSSSPSVFDTSAMAYNVSRSKGNHVWHIEAKKMMNGQWSFLHFQRKIIGTPPPEAYSGIKWSWTAKVWDPQCSAQNIQATFSSPDLPAWLSWKGNLLTGVPTHDLIGRSYTIVVFAATHLNSKPSCLDFSFKLSVKSADEMGDFLFIYFYCHLVPFHDLSNVYI